MPKAEIDEVALFPERRQPRGRRRRAPSRFATTHRTERRLILGIAVVAAIAGAFGTSSPCGYAVSDAVLQAGFAAIVALAASRARRWTLFWVSGLPAAFAGSVIAALPAVGALALSFGVVFTTKRRRAMGAAVGALAAQTLLRLPELDPYGLSTLIVTVSVVPLFVSAWRVAPRRVRRRINVGVLVGVVIAALGFVTLAASAAFAAPKVEHGISDARIGLQAARDADDDRAYNKLRSAADDFDDAHRVVSGWWTTPARMVPGLAQHAQVLEVATSEGLNVTTTGAEVAGTVDVETLRFSSGQIDLRQVEAVQKPLSRNAAALESAAERLPAVAPPWLLPPLADRLDQFEEEIATVAPEAELAADVAAVGPDLLGGNGERRYFVIFTQPAEARGLGGFMGSWAEITAVDGDLMLSRSGRTRELRDTPNAEARTIDGPRDYFERYQRFKPWVVLQDVTLSPDFPSVAEVMRQVYPQTGGAELDGVLAVDPYALAALMEFTGPIEVEDLDFPLTSENAAEFLVRDQYLEFGADEVTREDFLGDVTRQTFDKLTSGDLPSPSEVSSLLDPYVEQGRLTLWSRHGDEEALFEEIEADGGVSPRGGGDFLSLVTQNSANNKIDMFLERSIDYHATVDPDTGEVNATVKVELHNNVPSLDLPEVVIGSGDQEFPLGTNEVWFNLYSPHRFVSATVNGQATSLGTEREFDLWVYNRFFEIPPGETLTVEVELEGAIAPSSRYRLTYDQQPLVNPDQVSITVEGTEDWDVTGRGDLVPDSSRRQGSVDFDGVQNEVIEAVFTGR